MRRRAVLAACFAAAAWLLAPVASAQSGSSVMLGSVFGALAKAESLRTIDAQVKGQLVVSFHGDQASGCTSRGLCGYSGTVVFRPGGQAQFQIESLSVGTRHDYLVGLSFTRALTGSEVSRQSGSSQTARCADEQQPDVSLSPAVQHGTVTITLLAPGGSLLGTRCAGPLDSDLAAAGPSAAVAVKQLLKGKQTIDLTRTGSFAADGLAGTLSSTLQLSLGKPSRARKLLTGLGRKGKFKRSRLVTEKLSLTGTSGMLRTAVRGISDPSACALVDSCGFTGTLTSSPGSSVDSATLIAAGPAKLPRSRFVAALHGKREPGITVFGEVVWGPGGSLTESLAGPGETCSDAVPASGARLLLLAAKHALTAAYNPGPALRTRCPGPALGSTDSKLGSGQLSLAALHHPSFSLTLHGAGVISDDGYDARVGGALRLSFRRGSISQQVVRLPA